MTSIDENRNACEQAGCDTIMMNKMIVKVKDIRAIDSQLPGDLQNCPKMRASRFLKKTDLYTSALCLRGQPARMGEAVDGRLMTVRELTVREVEYQPFQATHIEIVDELYDAHGV